jgi:hypothetical protein
VWTVVIDVSFDLSSRDIYSNVRVWCVRLLLIARSPVWGPVILPVKMHSPYTSRMLWKRLTLEAWRYIKCLYICTQYETFGRRQTHIQNTGAQFILRLTRVNRMTPYPACVSNDKGRVHKNFYTLFKQAILSGRQYFYHK